MLGISWQAVGMQTAALSLQALWLHSLAQQDPDSALTAFRSIPESVVKDLTSWLAWVIRLGHAELLGAVPIGRLIAALTTLLQRPQLVRNAVVQSSIVELLSSMLLPLSRRSIRGTSPDADARGMPDMPMLCMGNQALGRTLLLYESTMRPRSLQSCAAHGEGRQGGARTLPLQTCLCSMQQCYDGWLSRRSSFAQLLRVPRLGHAVSKTHTLSRCSQCSGMPGCN